MSYFGLHHDYSLRGPPEVLVLLIITCCFARCSVKNLPKLRHFWPRIQRRAWHPGVGLGCRLRGSGSRLDLPLVSLE